MSVLGLILKMGSKLFKRPAPNQPHSEVIEKFRDLKLPTYTSVFSYGMQVYENKYAKLTDLPEKIDEVLDIVKDPSRMIGRQIGKLLGGFRINVTEQ